MATSADVGDGKSLPFGVFPTMITPFKAGGEEVDWDVLKGLVNWYIESGVDGLFSPCQSSEMFFLSRPERLELAKRVVEFADGRVPVVACGTFGESVEEMAEEVLDMAPVVDAVVVIVSQMCGPDDGNDVWKDNTDKLLRLTGETKLGLYECPKPYHRLLDVETLAWAADTGRFLFHKDTCCATAPIAAKIAATAKPDSVFRFFNANVATLLFSLEKGGFGFSGISANFYPWLHSWLCKNYKEQPEKAKRVQAFLSVAENVVMYKYPRSAKLYLAQFDAFPIQPDCRTPCPEFNEEETIKLAALKEMTEDLCADLGIPTVNPSVP